MFNYCHLSLILVSVSLISGQAIYEGHCPRFRANADFTQDSQFVGVWYLQYMYYYCPLANSKCNAVNITSIAAVGNSTNATFQFNQAAFNQLDNNLQISNAIVVRNPTNDYPTQVTVNTTGACFNDSQTCNLMGYNYRDSSYFILSCCQSYAVPGYIYTSAFIFTQNQTVSGSMQSDIRRKIFKVDLNSNLLLPILQNCVDNPLDIAGGGVANTTASSDVSSTAAPGTAGTGVTEVVTVGPPTLPGTTDDWQVLYSILVSLQQTPVQKYHLYF